LEDQREPVKRILSKKESSCRDCRCKIEKDTVIAPVEGNEVLCPNCAEKEDEVRRWEAEKECYELWYEYLKQSKHYQSLCRKIVKLAKSIEVEKKNTSNQLEYTSNQLEYTSNQLEFYYFSHKIVPMIESKFRTTANLTVGVSTESAKIEYQLLQRYYAYFGNIQKNKNFDLCWEKIMHKVRFMGRRAGYLKYPDFSSVSINETENSVSERLPVYVDLAASKERLRDDFNKFLDMTHEFVQDKIKMIVEPFPLKLHKNSRQLKHIKIYLDIYKTKEKTKKSFLSISTELDITHDKAKEGYRKAIEIIKNVEQGIFPGIYSGK
jgi:hypothetical protein